MTMCKISSHFEGHYAATIETTNGGEDFTLSTWHVVELLRSTLMKCIVCCQLAEKRREETFSTAYRQLLYSTHSLLVCKYDGELLFTTCQFGSLFSSPIVVQNFLLLHISPWFKSFRYVDRHHQLVVCMAYWQKEEWDMNCKFLY